VRDDGEAAHEGPADGHHKADALAAVPTSHELVLGTRHVRESEGHLVSEVLHDQMPDEIRKEHHDFDDVSHTDWLERFLQVVHVAVDLPESILE